MDQTEQTQANPERPRRRRRWLIATVVLVLLSPSCNSRPVGTISDADRAAFVYRGLVETTFSGGHIARDVVSDEGQPLTSWRLRIAQLMYGGPEHTWDQSVAWNEGENLAESKRHGPEIMCVGSSTETRVFAVKSEASPWEASDASTLADLPSGLVLFVVIEGKPIHWMQPGDLNISELTSAKSKLPPGGEFVVCFVDGQVWTLRSDIPTDVLDPFLTRSSAAGVDRESSLAKFSRHKRILK